MNWEEKSCNLSLDNSPFVVVVVVLIDVFTSSCSSSSFMIMVVDDDDDDDEGEGEGIERINLCCSMGMWCGLAVCCLTKSIDSEKSIHSVLVGW